MSALNSLPSDFLSFLHLFFFLPSCSLRNTVTLGLLFWYWCIRWMHLHHHQSSFRPFTTTLSFQICLFLVYSGKPYSQIFPCLRQFPKGTGHSSSILELGITDGYLRQNLFTQVQNPSQNRSMAPNGNHWVLEAVVISLGDINGSEKSMPSIQGPDQTVGL